MLRFILLHLHRADKSANAVGIGACRLFLLTLPNWLFVAIGLAICAQIRGSNFPIQGYFLVVRCAVPSSSTPCCFLGPSGSFLHFQDFHLFHSCRFFLARFSPLSLASPFWRPGLCVWPTTLASDDGVCQCCS